MTYKINKFFKTTQRITQYFGNNPEYYKKFGFNGHEGVDFGTPTGVELLSPFDGIILRDTDNAKEDNYGIKVVVWSPELKIALWFCHLSDNLVSVGDKVKAGQVIGHTGNTGNSTGAHCHVNFCETDATGNRINTSNGYKGFLNIFDYVDFIEPNKEDTFSSPLKQLVWDILVGMKENTTDDEVTAWTKRFENPKEMIKEIRLHDDNFKMEIVRPYIDACIKSSNEEKLALESAKNTEIKNLIEKQHKELESAKLEFNSLDQKYKDLLLSKIKSISLFDFINIKFFGGEKK